MVKYKLQLFINLIFLACSSTPRIQSFGFAWPFSSSLSAPSIGGGTADVFDYGSVVEFSMSEHSSNSKDSKVLENARKKSQLSNTCWQSAYRNLFAGCSDILNDGDKKMRLAWNLADCHLRDGDHPSLPHCDPNTPMMKCIKKLVGSDKEYNIYTLYYLETNTICYQLQSTAFKHQTEKLVNDLRKASTDVKIMIEDVLTVELKDMAASQSELKAGQEDMNQKLESGVALLKDSLNGLGDGLHILKNEATDIRKDIRQVGDSLNSRMREIQNTAVVVEKGIKEVGESMSLKMQDLQNAADSIGNVAEQSLDKQKRLLDGQTQALEGLEYLRKFQVLALQDLDHLTKFQTKALEESRDSVQQLAELTQKQQEELLKRQDEITQKQQEQLLKRHDEITQKQHAQLLKRQDQIREAHDLLIQSSKSILAAQEEFKLRQANIFTSLDKLFTLHNAILVESRFIKSFFFYASAIFVLYMVTSTKQTFNIRARLNLGLCLTFMLELAIIKYKNNYMDQQAWISSKVFLLRFTFLLLASVQILYSIFTFRDYEVLNHCLLQSIMEKVNIMEQQNTVKNLLCLSTDSDITGYSWIEDELPEDEDIQTDPNFILPEEVAENSITPSTSNKNTIFGLVEITN